MTHGHSARCLADVDPKMLRHDRLRGECLRDRRRARLVRRLSGEFCGLPVRRPLIPFNECIAEELFANETDDLFPAPNVVSQEIRHALEVRVRSGNRVSQIQTIGAQGRIRQIRLARLLQFHASPRRPKLAIRFAAGGRDSKAVRMGLVQGKPLRLRPRILQVVRRRTGSAGPPQRQEKPGVDLRIQIDEGRLPPIPRLLELNAGALPERLQFDDRFRDVGLIFFPLRRPDAAASPDIVKVANAISAGFIWQLS